ncbi:hypothetical protein ACFTZM_10145 [Streptomyces hydrogenans]|uniref:hypothetical protein n=1 Tax=Streptomyces hydrogenans TaxID=1873719 RepID=UPI0036415D75
MPGRSFRRATIAVLAVLIVGGTSVSSAGASGREGHLFGDPTPSATAAEAVPGIPPSGTSDSAVYLDEAGQVVNMPRSEAAVSRGDGFRCTPDSGRDLPHVSKNKVDASGHGWWDKGDCSSNRAKVFNCLYEYFTDHTWRRQACSPTKELRPGGGSSDRTVARRKCHTFVATAWRNHVEVDVIGELDTAEKPMREKVIACRVQ